LRAFDAVLFDFGETLFNSKSAQACAAEFRDVRSEDLDETRLAAVWASIWRRSREPAEIAKGRDISAVAHRRCWLELLAPLDDLTCGLAEFAYEMQASPRGWEPYPDTRDVLVELARREIRVGVVSDCGWDIRSVFIEHGLDDLVTSFDLSYEHGICKPAGEIFTAACSHLSVDLSRTLMVGDSWLTDGGAAAVGIMTLILPVRDRAALPALSQVLDLVR
jgi:HAD superfamily hydrolase (TIGR01549 family)